MGRCFLTTNSWRCWSVRSFSTWLRVLMTTSGVLVCQKTSGFFSPQVSPGSVSQGGSGRAWVPSKECRAIWLCNERPSIAERRVELPICAGMQKKIQFLIWPDFSWVRPEQNQNCGLCLERFWSLHTDVPSRRSFTTFGTTLGRGPIGLGGTWSLLITRSKFAHTSSKKIFRFWPKSRRTN